MIVDENNVKHVTADEGKTFRRKVDGFIMGNNMYLGEYIDGSEDSVDNYEEVDATAEEGVEDNISEEL